MGPAGTDRQLTALVVTPDTMAGAEEVNRVRALRNLAALQVLSIDFVEGYDTLSVCRTWALLFFGGAGECVRALARD